MTHVSAAAPRSPFWVQGEARLAAAAERRLQGVELSPALEQPRGRGDSQWLP